MDFITTEQLEQLHQQNSSQQYLFSGQYEGFYMFTQTSKSGVKFLNVNMLLSNIVITIGQESYLFGNRDMAAYGKIAIGKGVLKPGEKVSFKARLLKGERQFAINDRNDFHIGAPLKMDIYFYQQREIFNGGKDEFIGFLIHNKPNLILNQNEFANEGPLLNQYVNLFLATSSEVPVKDRSKLEIWNGIKSAVQSAPSSDFNANWIIDGNQQEYDFIKNKGILTSTEQLKVYSKLIDDIKSGQINGHLPLSAKNIEMLKMGGSATETVLSYVYGNIQNINKMVKENGHQFAYYRSRRQDNRGIYYTLMDQRNE